MNATVRGERTCEGRACESERFDRGYRGAQDRDGVGAKMIEGAVQ